MAVGCGGVADSLFCDGPTCAFSSREWSLLSALALSKLGQPPVDPTNFVSGRAQAIDLGRRFFADTRFSGASTQIDAVGRPAAVARAPVGQPANLSCVSCHDLARGGSDTASVPGNVSSGAGWSDVNALAIANVAYQHLWTWDGRADSLWSQAFAVAENPTTMNGDRINTAQVIFNNYANDYIALFGPTPLTTLLPTLPSHGKPGDGVCNPAVTTEPFNDAFDCLTSGAGDLITRVQVNWAKALAAYEETVVTTETPFDRFIAEGPTSNAISPAAQRGARLFVGKAACIDCHNTPLFSDKGFHDVGVPQTGPDVPAEADCPAGNKFCDCVTPKKCLPWGQYDGIMRLNATGAMLRTSVWSDDQQDYSRNADISRRLSDAFKGAWRTPSLRNVAATAPYMHDGVYATLEEVVAHYSRGPDPSAVGTPAADIKPLLLSDEEQADLVAFLESLSSDVTELSVPGGAPGGVTGSGSGGIGGGGPPDSGSAGGGGGPPPPTGLPCDVQTLLQNRCQSCHGDPPSDSAPFSLVSYSDVRSYAVISVAAMTDGSMPLGGPPATPAEIATLQNWINAGYPMGMCPVAPPPAACIGTPPSDSEITGSAFSPAAGGAVYTFEGGAIAPPMVMNIGSPVLDAVQVTANPGIASDPTAAYLGFGLPFGGPSCVDARAFNALEFTVSGDLGSCLLEASLVTSEDNSTANGAYGACVAGPTGCVPPFSGPLAIGTNSVCFSAMSGGLPVATVDPSALNGVQWILVPPTDPMATPCQVNITVTAVAFVSDPGCP